ncbi:MAG: hypothetical protein CL844_09710 [Crocinitomicaceae bacterium]|nr:hypothetical protein [Crocinitomicaceae bacterium]
MRNKILFFVISLFFSGNLFCQTQTIHHQANFSTDSPQSMWGANGVNFSLDKTITLFNESWNESFDTGSGGIANIAGFSFGGGLAGGISGVVGSEISLKGFTLGQIDVDYPVDVEVVMNQDQTYDQGDSVSITTSYDVESGYELETMYPSAGEVSWDFYFQMAANASAELCAFSCVSFPIIPSFDTGLQTINLVHISGNGATTGPNDGPGGQLGIWYLGLADIAAPDEDGIRGWPYAKPPAGSNSIDDDDAPWQVHIPVSADGVVAELPDNSFGLSGELSIPYVITEDNLNASTGNIQACGDSTYLVLDLEIFKVLGKILSKLPSPQTQAAGAVLANLSGSEELGVAEVTWNFFSASFDAQIANTQCFDFTPKVYGKYEFPVPVGYTIFNPSGAIVSSGNSSIINIEIGNTFKYKYPCYFDTINIEPTYTIDGIIRNHTYDQVTFNFNISALEFGFEIPAITVIPGFTIPEVCIPIPYPCPTWTKPWKWCTEWVCTPEIVVPPVGFPGWTLGVGPLLDESWPLGSGFSYDWFDDTWSLGGFNPITFSSFSMVANRLDISTSFADVDCYGSNTGSINVVTAAISPAFPYEYSWSNGTVTSLNSQSTNLTGLLAGPYQVTVYDNNGCQMFDGATISEPQELTVSYFSNDISCNGADDGSIDIIASGGTGGYTYTINNQITSSNITNLQPGSYNIVVNDAESCSKSISVTINEPPQLTQSGSVIDVSCKGGNDGEINVDVGGGVLPYTYSWDNPNSSTSEDLVDLSASTYILTITDDNGCISSLPYIVDEPTTHVSLSGSTSNVLCYGDSTGSVDVTTSGGTPGYVYQWSSIIDGVLPFVTEDLNSVPVGTYSLIVTDLKGCIDTLSKIVSGPSAAINSSPVLTNILCKGDLTGVIDPNISGGNSGYSYLWSTNSTQAQISGLQAGDYTLIVTDTNNCVTEFTYQLTEPNSSLSLTINAIDVLCHGDNSGEALIDISGGVGGYTYTWSNGEITKDISSLFSGNYSVTVIDTNSCSISDSIYVDEPVAPLTLSSTVIDVGCYGENTGSINLLINGGSSPYIKQWSNGNSIILSDTINVLSNQYSDSYSAFVTDNNGCTASLTSIINEPSFPLAISGSVNDVNCNGLSDGSIDINVTGGTIDYIYSWTNGSSLEDLSNVSADTYTVTVTDSNNCIATNSFIVEEPSLPLTVLLSKTDVLCHGDTDGQIESLVQGGTQPYTYSWSNSETSQNLTNVPSGIYTLNVTDDNGCSSFTGTTINHPDLLVVSPIVTDASCFGYNDGEIFLSIQGGIQPYYFNWGNENEILLNNSSETLDTLISNDYFIRVRDDNGCINEQIVSVDQPEPLVATAQISDVTCYDGNNGSIDLNISGGTAPYPIIWDDGQTTEDIFNLVEGNYQYTITDSQGCILSDSSYVSQPELIQIGYEIIPTSCIDQKDAAIFVNPYGGTVPYNYSWSNGSLDQNIESLAPGQYDLTIFDYYGCTQSFNFDININEGECLNIPNTFTPNNDNYNDTWIIGNIDLYPEATVKVFNKWGNEVFSSFGLYSPWEGTHRGVSLPSDVYYYVIILQNDEGNEYTGTITIIR